MSRLLVAALLLGCAPTVGWTRTDRACAATDPARICFEAHPDDSLTLTVGEVRLTPGECAFAPEDARGSIRVVMTDGATGEQTHRRVRARPGHTITVDQDLDRTRTDCQSTR